jgi:hypothetical protein
MPARATKRQITSATRDSSGPIALIGALTLIAAAIHGSAGAAASARYWALAMPAGVVYLIWRAKRRGESQWSTLIVVGLSALTFGAGAALGSITAADAALGCGLLALGAITRTPVLAATGAAVTVSAVTLAVVDAAGAWTAFSTGVGLLLSGLLLWQQQDQPARVGPRPERRVQ